MGEVSQEGATSASGASSGWPFSAHSVPTASGTGAVATTDEIASAVGASILARGGTAVDAAVATVFALAVVNPEAGGIGGSGFLLVRSPTGEIHSLDFRSTAPRYAAAALLEASLLGQRDATLVGYLASAVPGVVAGLGEVHRRFGTLPWSDLVAPAVELAEGFPAGDRLARSFVESVVTKLRRHDESAAIFLPGGNPPRAGEVFRQPDLAATLARIRDRGAVEFYEGRTAGMMAMAFRDDGGVLSPDDLVRYRPLWRPAIRVQYRDRTLVSTPPPSTGGVLLALIAGMMRRFDLSHGEEDPTESIHILAEVLRRAFADRNRYLGDPAFEVLPLGTLLDSGYADWRAGSIGKRATPSAEVAPGVDAFHEGEHTTHLSTMDDKGGAVSLTLTLNTWYGSGVVARGTGVLMNCDMDDFTRADRSPNFFGLEQGVPNRIVPGKRMLSAMAPAMVLGNRGPEELLLILGSPGGATIASTVFQVMSHILDGAHSPAAAIAAPRFHHQHLPDQIECEPGGISGQTAESLMDRGHRLLEREEFIGDVQLIAVEPDGSCVALSDPRRGGRPRAV